GFLSRRLQRSAREWGVGNGEWLPPADLSFAAVVHPLQLINKKAPPERAALFCAWGLDRSGKWELAKSQPFPIPDSPFPSQPLPAPAQATSADSQIPMVLVVRTQRLLGLCAR